VAAFTVWLKVTPDLDSVLDHLAGVAEPGHVAACIMTLDERSLGSERGLATPSPDGEGEITLSPSIKIMPLES
jgi:hypothetical protein